MNKDVVLFSKDGKDFTFEDILRKIYENTEEKKANIQKTVDNIAPLIKTLNDAVIIMPQLISLQEAAIRNDDALVRMAAVVQRGLGKTKSAKFNIEGDMGISPDERRMLLERAKEMKAVPGQAAGDE